MEYHKESNRDVHRTSSVFGVRFYELISFGSELENFSFVGPQRRDHLDKAPEFRPETGFSRGTQTNASSPKWKARNFQLEDSSRCRLSGNRRRSKVGNHLARIHRHGQRITIAEGSNPRRTSSPFFRIQTFPNPSRAILSTRKKRGVPTKHVSLDGRWNLGPFQLGLKPEILSRRYLAERRVSDSKIRFHED